MSNRVTAVLVDGRRVDGAVGDDGWAVVAPDGRPFVVEAGDDDGTVEARAAVS